MRRTTAFVAALLGTVILPAGQALAIGDLTETLSPIVDTVDHVTDHVVDDVVDEVVDDVTDAVDHLTDHLSDDVVDDVAVEVVDDVTDAVDHVVDHVEEVTPPTTVRRPGAGRGVPATTVDVDLDGIVVVGRDGRIVHDVSAEIGSWTHVVLLSGSIVSVVEDGDVFLTVPHVGSVSLRADAVAALGGIRHGRWHLIEALMADVDLTVDTRVANADAEVLVASADGRRMVLPRFMTQNAVELGAAGDFVLTTTTVDLATGTPIVLTPEEADDAESDGTDGAGDDAAGDDATGDDATGDDTVGEGSGSAGDDSSRGSDEGAGVGAGNGGSADSRGNDDRSDGSSRDGRGDRRDGNVLDVETDGVGFDEVSDIALPIVVSTTLVTAPDGSSDTSALSSQAEVADGGDQGGRTAADARDRGRGNGRSSGVDGDGFDVLSAQQAPAIPWWPMGSGPVSTAVSVGGVLLAALAGFVGWRRMAVDNAGLGFLAAARDDEDEEEFQARTLERAF